MNEPAHSKNELLSERLARSLPVPTVGMNEPLFTVPTSHLLQVEDLGIIIIIIIVIIISDLWHCSNSRDIHFSNSSETEAPNLTLQYC